MKKFASTLRQLKDAPALKDDYNIDFTLFTNFHGHLKNTKRINDPLLYKKASLWDKILRRK